MSEALQKLGLVPYFTQQLADTRALVGSSGVGKSTILNALADNSLAKTSVIREQDKKRRHTTTHRELHQLPSGGVLIDVPGIRPDPMPATRALGR